MAKKHLTVPEQVALLRDRGMLIADDEQCVRTLETLGYYRLSGYWYQFRIRSEDGGSVETLEEFIPGTDFRDILRIYEFDRELRHLLFQQIERLEVALRFQLGYILGEMDVYAHENKMLFKPDFLNENPSGRVNSKYSSFMWTIKRELDRSTEEFVSHHFEKYAGKFPIWVVTEVMSFQQLFTLFQGLKDKHQNVIAANLQLKNLSGYGLGGGLLNWLDIILQIRNFCAHHSRLWNRQFSKNLKFNHLRHLDETRHIFIDFRDQTSRGERNADVSTKRIYASIVVLLMLNQKLGLDPSWPTKIKSHLDTLPKPGTLSQMGFPANWKDQPIWAD
jgi:abortive infection bacteriophage resistance protein